MTPTICRADLHVHSTASQISRLGVQRSLGLPECATPPEEVYELAKRRGMDFVTITDHDTIDGALAICERPDVFISEELTARFRGEPQAVHVLCYGITPDDHDWLIAHNHDVELCAAYLHDGEIACALAHPFYAVAAPLEARHRRRLAQLFPIWETRNGARARELNLPAHVYIETHGGTDIGGSDDHAGVDVGRTYTEMPPAATRAEMLAHLRSGHAVSRGEQGSAAKWAHAAMALTVRALGTGDCAEPDPRSVLDMAARVLREGGARCGATGDDLTPADARSMLAGWLSSVGLHAERPGQSVAQRLLELMQADGFSHDDLFRRARRVHERKLAAAAHQVTRAASDPHNLDIGAAAGALFEACIPAIPYAPAVAFLGREKARLVAREGERPRVALVADAIGSMHGVTHALEQIRERGVPGFEVEVIGTDPGVDRRLSAVADVQVPYYPGLSCGVPSLPAVVEALSEGRFDLVHLCSPGPAGLAACVLARALELPVVASHHTELGAYVGLRSGNPGLELLGNGALASFYAACDVVLSPSRASDGRLAELGVPAGHILRWGRGVDTNRFTPSRRVPGLFGDRLNVLYAGRLTREKGVELLAEAFTVARESAQRAGGPDLHLLLAGGGPEEHLLRATLGEHATFLGWLGGDDLPRAYASADLFMFASVTDTFGQVLLEAQASGLPVLAVGQGGPTSIVTDGENGLLRDADPQDLADALLALAADAPLRERLARAGLAHAQAMSWEAALEGLARGYRRALAGEAIRTASVAAPAAATRAA